MRIRFNVLAIIRQFIFCYRSIRIFTLNFGTLVFFLNVLVLQIDDPADLAVQRQRRNGRIGIVDPFRPVLQRYIELPFMNAYNTKIPIAFIAVPERIRPILCSGDDISLAIIPPYKVQISNQLHGFSRYGNVIVSTA